MIGKAIAFFMAFLRLIRVIREARDAEPIENFPPVVPDHSEDFTAGIPPKPKPHVKRTAKRAPETPKSLSDPQ